MKIEAEENSSPTLAPSRKCTAATAIRLQDALSLADVAVSKSRAAKSSQAISTGTAAPLPSLTPDYATKLAELSGAASRAESSGATLLADKQQLPVEVDQVPKEEVQGEENKASPTTVPVPAASKSARRAQMLEQFGNSDLFGTGVTSGGMVKNATAPSVPSSVPVVTESKAARRARAVEELGQTSIFGASNICGAPKEQKMEKKLHRQCSTRKAIQQSTAAMAPVEENNVRVGPTTAYKSSRSRSERRLLIDKERQSPQSIITRCKSERKLIVDVASKKVVADSSTEKPPRAKPVKRPSTERSTMISSSSATSADADGSSKDLSSSSSRLPRHKSDKSSKDLRRRESRRRLTGSKQDGKSFRRTKSLEESHVDTSGPTEELPLKADRRSRRQSDTTTLRSNGARTSRQSGRRSVGARDVGACQIQQALTAESNKEECIGDEKKPDEVNDKLNLSENTLQTQEDSSGCLQEEESPGPVSAAGTTTRVSFFGSIQLPSLSAMQSQQEVGGNQSSCSNNHDSTNSNARSSFFGSFASNATTNANPRLSVAAAAKNMTTALFGSQYKGIDADSVEDNLDTNAGAKQEENEDIVSTQKEEGDEDKSHSFSSLEHDDGAVVEVTESSRRDSGGTPATIVKARQRQRRGLSRRNLSTGKGVSSRKETATMQAGAAEAAHPPMES